MGLRIYIDESGRIYYSEAILSARYRPGESSLSYIVGEAV